ncbi:MAG: hypothetical protein MZV64_59425 [Ignavibacteriales bacterium]|nr:hypothetical protein [Ignavibacteriales bacterium]
MLASGAASRRNRRRPMAAVDVRATLAEHESTAAITLKNDRSGAARSSSTCWPTWRPAWR